jgi:SLOG cluster3 family
MIDAIFLSAGVPDPNRGPQYAKTADTVAIAAAVNALVHVTLGRRILVWGGQPAITPMIWAVAEGLGVEYGGWVKLYQSEFFHDEFPEDNRRFENVTYTKAVPEDQGESLLLMRERMFTDFNFSAAIFVGGMGGILAEFEMLKQLQPETLLLPVTSTGGATLDVAERMGDVPQDLKNDLDYIGLFHRLLGISVKEDRYRIPDEQPANVSDRLWRLRVPNDLKA